MEPGMKPGLWRHSLGAVALAFGTWRVSQTFSWAFNICANTGKYRNRMASAYPNSAFQTHAQYKSLFLRVLVCLDGKSKVGPALSSGKAELSLFLQHQQQGRMGVRVRSRTRGPRNQTVTVLDPPSCMPWTVSQQMTCPGDF